MNCVHKSKAANAEQSSNHVFWRKMICLVAITFTVPKVAFLNNAYHLGEVMGIKSGEATSAVC